MTRAVGYPPPRADLYGRMAPVAEPDGDWGTLRRAGLASTRARRVGFRYFGLRLSALLLGLFGPLGVWLLAQGLGAETSTLAALPLPAYGALALGLPALFELIRPEPPRREKSRLWGRLLSIAFFSVIVIFLFQPNQGGTLSYWWLVPALFYLVPVLVGRLRARVSQPAKGPASKVAGRAPPNVQSAPVRAGVRPGALAAPSIGATSSTPRRAPGATALASRGAADTVVSTVLARGVGLAEALVGLLAVAVLPSFGAVLWLASEEGAPTVHLLATMLRASLFLIGVSILLAGVGVLSERLSPRFPRFWAAVVVFLPFGLSLVFPQVPSVVGVILGANHWILQHATSHWGLL